MLLEEVIEHMAQRKEYCRKLGRHAEWESEGWLRPIQLEVHLPASHVHLPDLADHACDLGDLCSQCSFCLDVAVVVVHLILDRPTLGPLVCREAAANVGVYPVA